MFEVIMVAGICIAMLLGWLLARKRNSADTHMAMQVIANLKATNLIYKASIEQTKTYLWQRINDLKITIAKQTDEKELLVNEIERLRKKLPPAG